MELHVLGGRLVFCESWDQFVEDACPASMETGRWVAGGDRVDVSDGVDAKGHHKAEARVLLEFKAKGVLVESVDAVEGGVDTSIVAAMDTGAGVLDLDRVGGILV